MSFFITGTDTGVGKTRFAAALIRGMRAEEDDVVGFKPICCGDRTDAEILCKASGNGIGINAVNPLWLRSPLSPYAAAMVESRELDTLSIREAFKELRSLHHTVIVEGAGGWLVPITREFSMADLAVSFGLPVLLLVANRLGAISHTLLTVNAIQAAGLHCAGIILNCPQDSTTGDLAGLTNRAVIEDLISVPVLAEIRFGEMDLPLPKELLDFCKNYAGNVANKETREAGI